MKYILYVASFVLPLVCGASIAMAFTPGVPPISGPGSVYHGNEEAAPLAEIKSKPDTKTEPEVTEATLRRTAKIIPN
jgi:hypothetical protein